VCNVSKLPKCENGKFLGVGEASHESQRKSSETKGRKSLGFTNAIGK
jgi:hypothetical protein